MARESVFKFSKRRSRVNPQLTRDCESFDGATRS